MTTETRTTSYVLGALRGAPHGRYLFTRTVHPSGDRGVVVQVYLVATPPWADQPDALVLDGDVAHAVGLPWDGARMGFPDHATPTYTAPARVVAAIGRELHGDETHFEERALP